jgi:hypothetical protein
MNMLSTLSGAALCAAVCLSGSTQAPTNISLVAAHEVATVKPGKPENPKEDDCVPIGVSKNPHGAVHGVEDCGSFRRHTRMDK